MSPNLNNILEIFDIIRRRLLTCVGVIVNVETMLSKRLIDATSDDKSI
jgi:hypothetical protein